MAAKIAGLLKWCKIQCEGYNNVDVTNFTSSWKSGLAFCAIIHKYRPDLINFDTLSPNDTYGNSKLAFDVALSLGIPALLDPEDMVQMKVPDKLCIITYVSQYYNYFHNKPKDGGQSTNKAPIKRPPSDLPTEPPPLEKRFIPPGQNSQVGDKRGTLDDKCLHCKKKVYILERHMNDGKLYHRHCFRESDRISSLKRNNGTEQLLAASRRLGSSIRRTTPAPANNCESRGGVSSKFLPIAAVEKNAKSYAKAEIERAKAKGDDTKASPSEPKQSVLNNDQKGEKNISGKKIDSKICILKTALESGNSLDQKKNQKQAPIGPITSSTSKDVSPNGQKSSNPLSIGRTSTSAYSKLSKKIAILSAANKNSSTPADNNSFTPANNNSSAPAPSFPSDVQKAQPPQSTPIGQTFNGMTPMTSSDLQPRGTPVGYKSEVESGKEISKPTKIKSQDGISASADESQKITPASITSEMKEARKSFFKQDVSENNEKIKTGKLEKSLNQPNVLKWKDSIKAGVFRDSVSSQEIAKVVGVYGNDDSRKKLFLPSFWRYSNVAKRRVSAEQPMSEAEISSSLQELDSKLKNVEEEGKKLEESIRSRSEDSMEEEEGEMKKWLHLVKKRSELIREESELIYQRQQQILEKQHEELEYQFRYLVNIPDDLKTTEIKKLEDQILEEINKIVKSRNSIVDSIENDRIRYEEEDKLFAMSLAGKNGKKKKKSLFKKKLTKKS